MKNQFRTSAKLLDTINNLHKSSLVVSGEISPHGYYYVPYRIIVKTWRSNEIHEKDNILTTGLNVHKYGSR